MGTGESAAEPSCARQRPEASAASPASPPARPVATGPRTTREGAVGEDHLRFEGNASCAEVPPRRQRYRRRGWWSHRATELPVGRHGGGAGGILFQARSKSCATNASRTGRSSGVRTLTEGPSRRRTHSTKRPHGGRYPRAGGWLLYRTDCARSPPICNASGARRPCTANDCSGATPIHQTAGLIKGHVSSAPL
jgi:hypothetical protein